MSHCFNLHAIYSILNGFVSFITLYRIYEFYKYKITGCFTLLCDAYSEQWISLCGRTASILRFKRKHFTEMKWTTRTLYPYVAMPFILLISFWLCLIFIVLHFISSLFFNSFIEFAECDSLFFNLCCLYTYLLSATFCQCTFFVDTLGLWMKFILNYVLWVVI